MRDSMKAWVNEVKLNVTSNRGEISNNVATYLGTINGLSIHSSEWKELYQLLVMKLMDRVCTLVSKQAQDSLDTNNGNIYINLGGRIDGNSQQVLGIIQLLSDKCNKYENMIGDLHGKCNKYENMIGDLHSRCTALESFCVVHAADFRDWGDRVSSLEKANPNLDKYATMIQKNFKLYILKKRLGEISQLYRLQQKFQSELKVKVDHVIIKKEKKKVRYVYESHSESSSEDDEPAPLMSRRPTTLNGGKAAEARISKANNRGTPNNASSDPSHWTLEKAKMISDMWCE